LQPVTTEAAHALSVRQVFENLGTIESAGLSSPEARRRLASFGPNHLRDIKRRSFLSILIRQFRGFIFWLLAGAGAFAWAIGDKIEAATIVVVLILNGLIGFFTELRATRSMEALRNFAQVQTRIRRDGKVMVVDARDLVPGDIVIIEAGDIITADLRLISSSGLECDESVLTGESTPVPKAPDPVAQGSALSERSNMLFKGSAVTRGLAKAIVVNTGMNTEIGRISALVRDAKPEATPLEEHLGILGQKLVGLILLLCLITVSAGYFRGQPFADLVQTGIALAVAAIPEGLPVVATLCLARGMWRMADRNALIRRISSVETLGATTLILTDKTGTITENRMTLCRFLLAGGDHAISADDPIDPPKSSALGWAIRIGAMCNSAGAASGDQSSGDPMELALLDVSGRAGFSVDRTLIVKEYAFDPDRRMMAQVHSQGDAYLFAVKGAPESVLNICSHVIGETAEERLSPAERQQWTDRSNRAAASGMRCLALAMKRRTDPDETPYSGLTLVGIAAFADPLRDDVPAAIAACKAAGVAVKMLTGDHAETATRIAEQAGIRQDGDLVLTDRDLVHLDLGDDDPATAERVMAASVFARVAPSTKLALATFFQKHGHIVAMTGDGVNDAPALRKSDIGIAMGIRGTAVAREAAEMVLRDDSFSTIVAAIHEGRVIFENLRNFAVYLMSCNLSEVLIVGIAVGAGLPAPLTPLQILFLNLVTDVFPAFALGLGPGRTDTLQRPPRDPAEPILGRAQWFRVGWLGGMITIATLCAFVLALRWLHLDTPEAVTVAFVTLSLAQLWNVFNASEAKGGVLAVGTLCNPYVWGAIMLCLVLISLALWVPQASLVLDLPTPGITGLAVAAVASLVPLLHHPLSAGWRWLCRRRRG